MESTTKTATVQEHLAKIQQVLSVPKNQKNTFGNYKYRSAEDILDAVKKVLDGAVLTLADNIVLVGDRYYVEATATFSYRGESIATKAYAREELDKKGMDTSQITGSTSSYARKYALNGLFCIDDTKDADTMDNTVARPTVARTAPVATPTASTGGKITWKQSVAIEKFAHSNPQKWIEIATKYGVKTISELSISEASIVLKDIMAIWNDRKPADVVFPTNYDQQEKDFNEDLMNRESL